jgi:hypothetical protein
MVNPAKGSRPLDSVANLAKDGCSCDFVMNQAKDSRACDFLVNLAKDSRDRDFMMNLANDGRDCDFGETGEGLSQLRFCSEPGERWVRPRFRGGLAKEASRCLNIPLLA